MFLKRIVLQGFKSFAERTEFEFGPGITSIVGPNGCGKSNVVDAIRWVLGEQSAHSLRGERMLDLIFNGSRTRKPANFAEVQLIFDNRSRLLASDNAEVAVGRMLYRDATSEYRLNGSACRLKDIRGLFLDTGIGVDAYSIIEQGRVDMLLQASPIQRREIFEEAAGVSRYKVQRTEAQRKLERSQQNLLRLNDVIDELEKRLRSVKLAAGKARNYQQYDARLRELRSAFSLAEYNDLEQSRVNLQLQADSHTDLLQVKRAELAARDAEAAEYDVQLQKFDEQIQAADAALAFLRNEGSALAERIAQGQRRMTDLAATRDRRRTQAAEIAERAGELRRRGETEDEALRELIAAQERGAQRIAHLRAARMDAERQCESWRAALEQEKRAEFEAIRRSTVLSNQRAHLDQQGQRLNAQADSLAGRQKQFHAEHEGLLRRREELDERFAALDRQGEDLAQELRRMEAQIAALEAESKRIEQHIGQEKETRSALISRLSLLEDMERRQEGVDQGARSVLAWRETEGQTGGVVGLAADVLRIDNPRVNLLQTVLATFENHIVARDTYSFLAELNRRGQPPGPVHVLALDRLQAGRPPDEYASAPGFVARAVDWVACEPEFQPLAEHLLGRVVLVDVVERALALAAGAAPDYVFVSLDGFTVGGGRLTVGVAKGAPGLISRKAEIRRLHGELEETEARLTQWAYKLEEIQQTAADLRLERAAVLQETVTVQRRHAEAKTELGYFETQTQRLVREAALLETELRTVQQALAEIGEQATQLGVESETVERNQRQHHAQVGLLESELARFEPEIARLAQELTEAMVELGRIVERRTASEEALNELRSRLTALQREQAAAEHEAIEAVSQLEKLEAELADAQTRQGDLEIECERRQAETLRLRDARQELRQRIENCGAATKQLHGEIQQVEAALHECGAALREIAVRKENLTARVREELALDLAELYASYEHMEQDWEAIKTEIEELRQKIARLGHVNLDAIAELEELTPRFENLVAQRADLLTSIERLQQLIADLDVESRARFTATFQQIREHFQELFRKLFGGGKADIILENPEDPLECGIDVIARPPGKEPQSISLLSGGEKTMTTVALLMAVFKSKPSPFTILDEVDAALDESNVERFNTVLHEFLSHSQFIVVTHNKRTMQSADALYGVTMEEPGVSKRVCVRFEERVNTPTVA